MEERVPPAPPSGRRTIRRGADDQAAALRDVLARAQSTNAEDDEREWEIVKRGLQETRRALGQRLLFPE